MIIPVILAGGSGTRRRAAGDFGGDLGPGAEARIKHAHLVEPGEGGAVILEMLGLATDRRLPGEAKPSQVFEDRRLEFRSAAGRVYVLDPQKKPTARSNGRLESQMGRIGVTDVQESGWARGEARNDRGFGHSACDESFSNRLGPGPRLI